MNTENIGKEHFLYFSTIRHNLFGGFESLRNNNGNNLLSLSLLEFKKGLEEGFNLLSRKNLRRLDLNVAALVNVLTRVNLKVNYIKRKSNHVKLTEFRRIEAEDFNE